MYFEGLVLSNIECLERVNKYDQTLVRSASKQKSVGVVSVGC